MMRSPGTTFFFSFLCLGLLGVPAHVQAQASIAAAVLPGSRAVQVGSEATVYASIVNTGTQDALGCSIASTAEAEFPGTLTYYTTDPVTNQVNSGSNPIVDVGVGGVQSFAISLQPDEPMESEVAFTFDCANSDPAVTLSGINTLQLAAATDPLPDIVALAATSQNDGTVHLDARSGAGALAVATVNLGAAAAISVSAATTLHTAAAVGPLVLDGGEVAISLCQTDPATGQCLQPATTGPVMLTVDVNETPTFAVFVSAVSPIASDPANHRIFVRFYDSSGNLRGATSVAVERPSAYDNWSLEPAAPETLGLSAAAVDDVLDRIFTDAAVQGAAVVYRGSIIGERYVSDRTSLSLGTTWSVAKSFYAALVGAAVQDGDIGSLDDRVSQYVADWAGTERGAVTIRQLLQMRAGLPGDSNGCGGIFFDSDQTSYAVSRTLVRQPGSAFEYSNCGSQILEPLLRNATGSDVHGLIQARLLAPIGINVNTLGFWLDPGGINPLTYCCVDMSLRDFARFGVLMARRGEWDGAQVLPADFVDETLRAANQQAFYGLHWWMLNSNYFGAAPPVELASAQGLDGQWIIVWPEQDFTVAIQTRYEHPPEQGYVLSLQNYPDTCTARNTCPGASGGRTPSFDTWELVQDIAALFGL